MTIIFTQITNIFQPQRHFLKNRSSRIFGQKTILERVPIISITCAEEEEVYLVKQR